jgi:hypothetical protein
MSITSADFPQELYARIFSLLPALEVVKNCRLVCKAWDKPSKDLTLWQNIATTFDIELENSSTSQEIENSVKNYVRGMGGKVVISSKQKLDEKISQFFKTIGENDTKAIHYRSASDQKCYGFYVKTTDPAVAFKINQEITTLFHSIQPALRITGKEEADLKDKGTGSEGMTYKTSLRAGTGYIQQLFPDEKFIKASRVEMKGVCHSIEGSMLTDP